ncbi:MAG: hypothetical protein HQL42_13550 [Alphaproteobacteria bacterium]|nr:hypothetical protein [Alphaproteobacteria bacterium]
MASGRENFEVQVLKEGRWVTESARDKEEDARALAKKFLSDKSCAGARVMRNWLNRDGSMNETVLFEQTQSPKGESVVRINPIESAPAICERPRDYFGLESRMAMNRIFRTYLEQVFLTPTELLHNAKELSRIREKDSLVPSAVDLVATLQTKGTEIPTKQRRDDIFAALDQIYAQARRADGLKLPQIGERFSDLFEDLAGKGEDGPEYLAMVVLSRDLIGRRNWVGKLDQLCRLALGEPNRQAGLLLDTVIADVLGANIIQEILGWQPALGSAIVAMLDLADGKFDCSKSEAQDTTEKLNKLFGQGRLPGSRHVMIERAMRQLKSSNPLSRNDPGKEMEEYQKVLVRLLSPGGLLAGAEAAEALTVRGTRFVEQGGPTGRRAAITNTVHALPDKATGVMYLAELSKTGFADEHLADIVKQLDLVFSARVIGELTRRTNSPKERLQTATNAFNAALSSALPDEVKKKVTAHIDGVLERFLVDENVIEKLDHPTDHIRDRAVRLVKFAGAGVLPEGKALARARERIIKLLRMPNFDARFVEGISDPEKQQKALRDFHQLLVKAGFG